MQENMRCFSLHLAAFYCRRVICWFRGKGTCSNTIFVVSRKKLVARAHSTYFDGSFVSASAMARLTFYFDIVSPYSYIAFEALKQYEHKLPAKIVSVKWILFLMRLYDCQIDLYCRSISRPPLATL